MNGTTGGQVQPLKSDSRSVQLITKAETCRMLCVSRSTLERTMRSDATFPQAIRIGNGRTVRFVEGEVLAYVNARTRVEYDDHAFDPNDKDRGV